MGGRAVAARADERGGAGEREGAEDRAAEAREPGPAAADGAEGSAGLDGSGAPERPDGRVGSDPSGGSDTSAPADASGGSATSGGVDDVVRDAVVQLAAEVLGALHPRAVPPQLAAVRRFAPRRRAGAGAGPLWAALESDAAFRARVARAWAHLHVGLAARLPEHAERGPGTDPALSGADRVALAVGAFLLRPSGWARLVTAVAAEGPRDESGASEPLRDDPAHDRRSQVAAPDRPSAARDQRDADVTALAARLAAAVDRAETAEAELVALRREQRRLRADADRARAEARRAEERAADVAAAAERVHAEAARVHTRAEDERRQADALVAAARADAAALRELADVRVRLLLDTIVEAGSALRAELALPPAGRSPAELVAATTAPAPAPRPTSRGRGGDDPALLDELLALPRAHLVVDGYNVSKLAWEGLPLAEQRRRLTDRLANTAARTGAEVTCCFDGQDTDGVSTRATPGPRGVRVLFSSGEIADDLIRRLVRAEPRGRVVVAVTSDRALAADLEAAGARVLPSATLIARFGRM